MGAAVCIANVASQMLQDCSGQKWWQNFDLETVCFRHALKTTVPDSIGFGVRLTDTDICFHNLVCLADSWRWIFVDCAWGELCDIVLKAPSSVDVAAFYWFSLTLRHLEVFPHGAQDRAGQGLYRRGSNWELFGPGPSQDAGGREHSTGRSSCSATLRSL